MSLLLKWTYMRMRAFAPVLLITLASCASLPERQNAPLPYETRVHAAYSLVDLIGADKDDYLRPIPWLMIANHDGAPMSLYRLNVGYRQRNKAQVPESCAPRFDGDRVRAGYRLQGSGLDRSRQRRSSPNALVQSGVIAGFVDDISEGGSAAVLPVNVSGQRLTELLALQSVQLDLKLEKVCHWARVDTPDPVAQEVLEGALAIALFSPIAVLSWGYVGAYEATHSSGIGDVPRDAAWEAIASKFPVGQSLTQSPEALMADYPNKWRLIERVDGGLDYIVLEPGRPRKGEGDRSHERQNVVIGLQETRVEWAGWVEEHVCEQLPMADRERICQVGWVHFRD